MYGCICKGYTEFWISLYIAQYPSILPKYTLLCLTTTGCSWMSLNIPENVWTNCFDYTRILNMSHHLLYLTDVKYARVLNIERLYTQGLNRVLNMSVYGSICLIILYIWQVLNMPGLWTCCDIVTITLLLP